MKLRSIKVEVIDGTDALDLQNNITAFIAAAKEQTFIEIQYQLDAGVYSALILYTE